MILFDVLLSVGTCIMALFTIVMGIQTYKSRKDSNERWIYEKEMKMASDIEKQYHLTMNAINQLKSLLNNQNIAVDNLFNYFTDTPSANYYEQEIYKDWVRQNEHMDVVKMNDLLTEFSNKVEDNAVKELLNNDATHFLENQIKKLEQIASEKKVKMIYSYEKAEKVLNDIFKNK